MQTFLPYPDYAASARVLDYRRLGKQRVETFQLLNAILGIDKNGVPVDSGQRRGWVNHPAAVMWRQYPMSLAEYGIAICDEWIGRGYNDSMRQRLSDIFLKCESDGLTSEKPWWLGDPDIHRSHQSNLLRKDFEYYAKFFDGVPADLEYVWPAESRTDLTTVTSSGTVLV